jgi:hypothetical protein
MYLYSLLENIDHHLPIIVQQGDAFEIPIPKPGFDNDKFYKIIESLGCSLLSEIDTTNYFLI